MANDTTEDSERTGEYLRIALDGAVVERDRLFGQMRAANERLVLATLAAEESADVAEAARAAARHSELRFRALVATSTTVFWEADPAGNITVDPEAWLRFAGTAFDVSRPTLGWIHAVHPDDSAAARTAWSGAQAAGDAFVGQYRLRTEHGELWIMAHAVPIFGEGVLRDWIGTLTDINDRVRIEEAKERFIAILGHDLRNPLAAISIGAEMFRGMPEPYDRVAQQMLRSAGRMDAMIRDMIDFTRGRLGGGIPVTLAPCDLGVLALEVTQEIRQAHPRRDIACDVLGDLRGACDPARAEQVFSNLLGNAVAHGADPIRMTVIADGDDVAISVKNRGAPIPPAVIPTLFEPFGRRGETGGVHTPRSGLGLGLYIVREIVAAHGGAIAISSSVEAGTEVAIRWPRRKPPTA